MTERFIILKGYRVIKKTANGESAVFYDKEDGQTFLKWLNELTEENEQLKKENQSLKEEKELLKNKLDRIEDILPHFLSCAEISEFRGKTVKEDLALMKCWNKRYQK